MAKHIEPEHAEPEAPQPRRPDLASDDTLILASDTLSGDLRDFLLDRLRHQHSPLPWNMRPESEQRETIDQAERAAKNFVRKAVQMIAADGRKVMKATLAQVTVKDGIKAQVELMKSDPMRHELIDAQGLEILLVVSDASVFEGERAPVHAKPDQADMLDETDAED